MPIYVIQTCEYCGVGFQAKRWFVDRGKGRFCSRKCFGLGERGKSNPSWIGGPKNYSKGNAAYLCQHCGKEFRGFSSRPNKYCSVKCKAEFKTYKGTTLLTCDRCGVSYRKPNSMVHPGKHYCSRQCWFDSRPEKIDCQCENCGKHYTVNPSALAVQPARFCSKKCMGEKWRGENSPTWKGGYYKDEALALRASPEYAEWRRQVFERDKYTCQKCDDSKGGNLHGHHVYPYMKYKDVRLLVQNGITFCKKCHNQFHLLYGTINFSPEDTFRFLGYELPYREQLGLFPEIDKLDFVLHGEA